MQAFPWSGKRPSPVDGDEVESYDIPVAGIGEASSVHLISRRCRSLSETRHRRQLPLKGKPLGNQPVIPNGAFMVYWNCRGRNTPQAFPWRGSARPPWTGTRWKGRNSCLYNKKPGDRFRSSTSSVVAAGLYPRRGSAASFPSRGSLWTTKLLSPTVCLWYNEGGEKCGSISWERLRYTLVQNSIRRRSWYTGTVEGEEPCTPSP